VSTTTAGRRRPRAASAARGGQTLAGWLFTAPALVLLGLFLVIPVLMAAWVSVSDWNGRGSPFAGTVGFVGTDNFRDVLTSEGGLQARDFGTALRNNFWYVVLVVPLQTAISLGLAVLVNRKVLRGRGFFRTAFYFPSVTSSVAIVLVFTFLFAGSGAVNQALGWLGINGPNWFADPRGVLHVVLGAFGVDQGPAALTGSGFLSISWWEWLAGPSVAMSALVLLAVFTTSGTFMLLFLAALQNISGEVAPGRCSTRSTSGPRADRRRRPSPRRTCRTRPRSPSRTGARARRSRSSCSSSSSCSPRSSAGC
jgi:multiple sugar transport system permease protein